MSEQKFYIPSLSDGKLYGAFLEAFRSIESAGRANGLQLSFVLPLLPGAIAVAPGKPMDPKLESYIKESSGKSIVRVTLSFSNVSVVYSRTVQSLSPNGSYGELKTSSTGASGLRDDELVTIMALLLKQLYVGKADKLLEVDKDIIASHSEVLSKLESIGVDIQNDTRLFRKSLEEEHRDKEQRLEQSFTKSKEALERDYAEKFSLLNEQRKRLDDKSNTHARREIRKDITSAINERIKDFQLSKSTSRLRLPIHVAFLLLIALSSAATLYYSKIFFTLFEDPKFLENRVAVAFAIVKSTGLAALLSTTTLLYIRWLNAWFNKNASEEMTLRRFQLDIERSSWIVETVLESVSQHSHQLPTELVLKFSNNLFSKEGEKASSLRHPIADVVSSLVGNATKAKFKLGENEVELNKQGLTKAFGKEIAE